LPNALSLYFTAFQLAAVAGPAIGGALLGWTSPTLVYLVDVASFVIVIAALLAMEHRRAGQGVSRLSTQALFEGLNFLWSTPLLWSTMLLDFVATFFAGSLLLMPIFADQLLQVGTRGLGLLYAAQPLGAVLMGAALSARP